MADPTIQTFCCTHSNNTDVAFKIMNEFDTDAYNIVCIVSSTLGILGAIYQILPREEFTHNHKWFSLSAKRGRKIIVWLAFADLLASLGVFIRSTIWISYKNIMPSVNDDSSVVFCAISSALTQYFYTATWIWTLCYALDMRRILKQKESKTLLYHLVSWVTPAILTTIGLLLLYIPDADCFTPSPYSVTILRYLPNYLATYAPIAAVMIANPCLYRASTRDMEELITSASGQHTIKEREIIRAIKIKFSVINIVFYVCWLPNLLNGILIWTLWFHFDTSITSIWYVMALLNPLQAVFNCIVYRRWSSGTERVILPWRQIVGVDSVGSNGSSKSSLDDTVREEIYPLLQNTPTNSVNLYKSLS
ncbi:unnamed protein product [Phyllotreta striolata]|uniref:G-protein coupled receptor 143 n=1 Tax=Phyllotreta striolata TaxID=444603 RepID=A0A9N9TF57_PHYSR|nr:unnamed protein product [Phyllotreta striolata]